MSHKVPVGTFVPEGLTVNQEVRAAAIQAACVLASRRDLLSSHEQLALAFRFATVIAEYIGNGEVAEL